MTERKTVWSHRRIALSAAFVALLPQFWMIYLPERRFHMIWNSERYTSILISVLILAFIYYACFLVLSALLGRYRLCRWRVSHVFAWALFVILTRSIIGLLVSAGVLDEGIESLIDRNVSKLIYYAVIPGAAILFYAEGFVSAIKLAYIKVVAPVALILVVLPLFFDKQETVERESPEKLAALFGGENAEELPNIYIVLLDGWSRSRVIKEGEVWSELPRLKELAGQFTIYHNAYSPAPRSHVSISRFLFQEDERFQDQDFYETWGRVVESKEHELGESIFEKLDDRWKKVLIGNALEYERILGDQLDYSVVFNQVYFRGFQREVKSILWSQLQWFRYAGINVKPFAYRRREFWIAKTWFDKNEQIHRMAKEVINEINAPTFAMFHYCLPHYPYVYNAAGRLPELPVNPDDPSQLEPFLNNLRYTDTIIGDLVDTLEAAGKYDSSLIMFFADHTWRWDPDLRHYRIMNKDDIAEAEADPHHFWKRVPLFIKWPGQISRVDVHETNYTVKIFSELKNAVTSE